MASTNLHRLIERDGCAGPRCLNPPVKPGERFCAKCKPDAIKRGRKIINDRN